MPILLLGAIALFGLGYWEYKRGAFGPRLSPGQGTPNLPPVLPANASPQQVVTQDAPALAAEVLDLLYNGRDPRAMHAVASELEKDGFFDAAAILHKRAGELEAAAQNVPLQGFPPPPAPGVPMPPTPPAPAPGVVETAVLAAKTAAQKAAASIPGGLGQTIPGGLGGLSQTGPSGLRQSPQQPFIPGVPSLFSGTGEKR
jgi:hypothetical protein